MDTVSMGVITFSIIGKVLIRRDQPISKIRKILLTNLLTALELASDPVEKPGLQLLEI